MTNWSFWDCKIPWAVLSCSFKLHLVLNCLRQILHTDGSVSVCFTLICLCMFLLIIVFAQYGHWTASDLPENITCYQTDFRSTDNKTTKNSKQNHKLSIAQSMKSSVVFFQVDITCENFATNFTTNRHWHWMFSLNMPGHASLVKPPFTMFTLQLNLSCKFLFIFMH